MRRSAIAIVAALAVFAVALQFGGGSVEAAGPPYSGPVTDSTGPAYFGPAPNPIPYCDNPTYFDPFPENVNPIGRIDVDGAPNASVTTGGITMDFELTAEGDPGGQYPGFFPEGADGGPGDQPKGVEMASDDAATVTLSEPLFYSQWVFTDVDRANEGFDVTPNWTDPGTPGQVAVFGGDTNFDFTGTTVNVAEFNDTDQIGQDSESINGRVQVDFLGAVQSLTMVRDTGSGQSGFAVGGGCSPIGASKEVTATPTWNGSSFDVTYTIRVRNNLPSTATLTADVNDALANAASGSSAGTPTGIDMTNIQLTDLLTDSAFTDVTVVSLTNTSGNIAVNDQYDGDGDTNLIADGEAVPPESEEAFVLVLQYTPDPAAELGGACAASYQLLNSAQASGQASGVDVTDLSDEGADPDPGVDNGGGGNDDPTVVTFDCPPPAEDPVLEIVKTAVAGPAGACPAFAAGVAGDGPALDVVDGDTVTYCISVLNSGAGDASNVDVTDPMAPAGFDGAIGDLAAGDEATVSFDLVVDDQTPAQNTASASGDGPNGAVGPVTDTALINVDQLPDPVLEIVKTAVAGPAGACPAFANGVAGDGAALNVLDGDVVTYCISVLNSGAGDATNVVVTDPMAPAAFDGTIGDLAAGAEGGPVSFDLQVDTQTPGQNTASVTGDGPNGAVGPVTDTAIILVDPLPDPALEIVKTAVAGPAGACPAFAAGVAGDGAALALTEGDTVTYCISVLNSGAGDATNVVVTDPMAPAGFDGAIGDLAAGAEGGPVSFDIVVDAQTPAQNTATVNGDGPNGPATPATDTALVDVSPPPVPSISVSKTVLAGAGGDCATATEGVDEQVVGFPNDAVTWCVTIANDGETDLVNVIVNDPFANLSNVDVLNGAVLPVGDSATVPVAGTIPAAGAVNVVDVTADPSDAAGNPLAGGSPVSDTNDASVESTDISLEKSISETGAAGCPGVQTETVIVGAAVTYCFEVTNTGTVALDVTEVVDADLGIAIPVNQILAPGASTTVTADTVAADPFVNNASVIGQPVDSQGTPIPGAPLPSDTSTTSLDTETPSIDLVKTVLEGPNAACPSFAGGVAGAGDALAVNVGDTVTFCVTVINDGDTTVNNIVINDTMAAAPFTVPVLAAGVEATFTYDILIGADTATTNTATATGEDPSGNQVPPATDTAIIDVSDPNPSIMITKTVIASGGDCADAVEGTDEMLVANEGDAVTWCYVVTNNGNVPLANVIVDDAPVGFNMIDVLAVFGNNAAVLAVGDSVSFSLAGAIPAGGVTSEADVDGAAAEADGTLIAGVAPVEDSNDAGVDELSANLSIAKTVSDAGPVAGGTILTYSLVVANAGPDAAEDVAISDVLPDGLSFSGAVPAPDGWACMVDGQTLTCARGAAMPSGASDTIEYSVEVTTSAATLTDLVNTATVTSTTNDPDPSDNTDTGITQRETPPANPTPVPTSEPARPADPGPLTIPDPPAAPAAPPLALTGASSTLMATLAMLMLGLGGFFAVGARRSDEDNEY